MVPFPLAANNITTNDGDITMSDLRGDCDLQSSDGDIAVGSIVGSIRLKTSDGDIRASAISGPNSSVQTSDGDVSIGALTGPADVATSDGDISVSIESAYDIELRSGDGDITVYAHRSINANVDFTGEGVELAPVFSLRNGRLDEYGASGTLNGGGPTLHAHTGDGTISVRETRADR